LYGLAGLRVGYCAAKEDFINAIQRVSPPFSVNRFAQIGAAAALEDKEHIKKTKEMNESGKRFLYENFDKMSVFYIPSDSKKWCQAPFSTRTALFFIRKWGLAPFF
jgi:histidinol-phosphate aminotransferase